MMKQVERYKEKILCPLEAHTSADSQSGRIGDIDINMIKKLSSVAGSANIDANQRALLTALRPYIGHHRLSRLERAMQAARMANMLPGLMGR